MPRHFEKLLAQLFGPIDIIEFVNLADPLELNEILLRIMYNLYLQLRVLSHLFEIQLRGAAVDDVSHTEAVRSKNLVHELVDIFVLLRAKQSSEHFGVWRNLWRNCDFEFLDQLRVFDVDRIVVGIHGQRPV